MPSNFIKLIKSQIQKCSEFIDHSNKYHTIEIGYLMPILFYDMLQGQI